MSTLRGRAVSFGFDLVIDGMTRAMKLRPEPSSRSGVRVLRDLSYGKRLDQRLDVYLPTRHPGPRPAALYVHGGGFRILSKDTHFMMASKLAKRGWIVFCVDYRLAPAHPFPAGLEDVVEALLWVLDHAAEHGADASRLLLAGESAGGNLVTCLALAASFPRQEGFARAVFERAPTIASVAPLCPMLDVAGRVPSARERSLAPWVQERIARVCRDYAGHVGDERFFASPIHALESDLEPARPLPRFFTSVGGNDPILSDTRRLHRALERRGVPHRVRYYSGEGHAFQARYWSPQARRSWADLFEFLEV